MEVVRPPNEPHNDPIPAVNLSQYQHTVKAEPNVFPPQNSASLCAGLILWQVFKMKTEDLEKQVELLSVLVDGCKKHPAYRAIRPATGRCKPCVDMWQARQELEELNK